MDAIEEFPVVTPSGVADTNQAALCKVCQRAKTRIQPDPAGRVLACTLCERVDATVAELHGARLLTPLNRNDYAPHDVLYHRLFDGDVLGTRTARFQEHHTDALIRMNELAFAEGTRHLVVRHPGGWWRGLLVDWERWQQRFPASLSASVRAYELYLTRVHAWALEVEPRLHDSRWLIELVGGSNNRD